MNSEAKRARLMTLGDQLHASYTPEQRGLAFEIEDLRGELSLLERDELVDAIAAHFPGFGSAIYAVADHLLNLRIGEPCRCLPTAEAAA